MAQIVQPDPPEPRLGQHLVKDPVAEIILVEQTAELVTEHPLGDFPPGLPQGLLFPRE